MLASHSAAFKHIDGKLSRRKQMSKGKKAGNSGSQC